MKLAIVGSRGFTNYELLVETLESYKDKVELVVSGGATGADKLGEKWAKENNVEIIQFLPDWKTYKNAAGLIRNKLIVENCDKLIAFWDNKSKGTQYTINLATKQNKLERIILYEKITN